MRDDQVRKPDHMAEGVPLDWHRARTPFSWRNPSMGGPVAGVRCHARQPCHRRVFEQARIPKIKQRERSLATHATGLAIDRKSSIAIVGQLGRVGDLVVGNEQVRCGELALVGHVDVDDGDVAGFRAAA